MGRPKGKASKGKPVGSRRARTRSNKQVVDSDEEPAGQLEQIQIPKTSKKSYKRRKDDQEQGETSNKRGHEEEQVELDASNAVEFQEGDQLIEMTVQGQHSDFASDEDQSEEEDEAEITFNLSQASQRSATSENNNATIFSDAEDSQDNDAAAPQKIVAGRPMYTTSSRQEDDAATGAEPFLSVEEKQNIIGQAVGEAVAQVQDLIKKSGFIETANKLQQQLERSNELAAVARAATTGMVNIQNSVRPTIQPPGTSQAASTQKTSEGGKRSRIPIPINKKNSMSEITIYENAVKDATKRTSSSSEEADMSDEVIMDGGEQNTNDSLIDQFIIGQRRQFEDDRRVVDRGRPIPLTSGYGRGQAAAADGAANIPPNPNVINAESIRKAEVTKAKIYTTPGEFLQPIDQVVKITEGLPQLELDTNNRFVHSAMVDENYLVLGNHVDAVTRQKIVDGEYIDFAKLLPRDHVMIAEDLGQKMEVVNKDGHMYWVPATELTRINSFAKWEQAFRIYSDIYGKGHPSRTTELIEYSHLIYTASLSYVWDNVYRYDIDFRLHMGMFPNRSWSIILQQAWSIRLKDKLKFNSSDTRNFGGAITPSKHDDGWDNLCKRFNKGKCNFGPSCRFEHRCKYCRKFGHGMHVCRKLKFEKNNAQQKRDSAVVMQETKGNKSSN